MLPARRSHAWTLRVLDEAPELLEELSWTAFEGFEYAEALARDARQRYEAGWGRDGSALRVAHLAVMHNTTPASIRYAIRKAREELFGKVSDSTINRRLARRRELAQRPERHCVVCGEPLPREARRSRLTCSGRCRVWKHRHGPAWARPVVG